MTKDSGDSNQLRQAIEEISNELCLAVDGQFDFTVHHPFADESVQKLGMLINFLLDAARRALSDLAEKNAKLSELDRLKSDFIANVSHELRTPLTLILGPISALLEDSGFSPKARDHIERVHRNAARLFALVNDLLEFSRVEAGQVRIEKQSMSLNDAVEAIVEDARMTAESRGLSLTFSRGSGNDRVLVDPRMFEKIVLNLLGNALKFTQPGGRINLTTVESTDFVELIVADSGLGISPSKLNVIFQRFQQIESAANRRYEGTGIGLALVKEFAEIMGGSVGVESEEGKGSRFIVRFPRHHGAVETHLEAAGSVTSDRIVRLGPVIQEQDERDRLRAEDPAKPLVLIVEDNIDMRQFLIATLGPDFRVRQARNGTEALAALPRLMPDIVVTDMMMPEMSGMELIARMKADDRLRHLPIIILTARAGGDAASVGLEAGADDYLSKPFTPVELRARIRACLRLRRLIEERTRFELECSRAEEEIRAKEELLAGERSARAAAERLARMKDEFLATLSHELRTPLNSLLGWSQLLLRNATARANPEIADGLEIIERNAKIQRQLISDLLELSQISAGKVSLDLQELDLRQVAQSLVHSTGLNAASQGIAFDLNLPAEPVLVRADPSRLQQIFGNLLSNAIKFSDPGSTVTVSVADEMKCGALIIKDTGRGIRPDFLEHIFDRFRQEDATITRKYGGLGIGLSVVKQLVQLHHGTVYAESQGEGQGATFTVTFPLADPLDETDAGKNQLSKKELTFQGVHVLVVEDDADTRAMICRLLESCRAKVFPACSALEALDSFGREQFDLVISDIGMPEIDGYELMRKIREFPTGAGRKLPAIALTAYALPADKQRALQAGYQLHLAKPVDANELIAAVGALVEPKGDVLLN